MASDPIYDFLAQLPEADYAATELHLLLVAWWQEAWGAAPTATALGRRAKRHPRVFYRRTAAGRRYLVRATAAEIVAEIVAEPYKGHAP